MDLMKFNLSCEMTTDEFLRRLGRAACLEEVQSLCGSLFAVAMEKGLVDEGGRACCQKEVCWREVDKMEVYGGCLGAGGLY